MSGKHSTMLSMFQSISMSEENRDSNVSSRGDELEYLSDMIPQMRLLALGLEEQTLAYLLELAMIEARVQLDMERFKESVLETEDS